MPNNFAYIDQKSDLRPFQFDKALILNEAGDKIVPKTLKGKIVLLDIWHSACLPCIRKFPNLQALQDKYANDSLVKIFALNIPLEKDGGEKPVKFTQLYSFSKLYFANEQEAEKFSVDEVPLILIFDKNLKCCYAGGLNIEWNIFTGNAEKIIDKLKSEE
jgi:thiol-disulfide isomerase/thioredoxin